MNLEKESFRSFLLEYVKYYKSAREKIEIPLNSEEFIEKIKNIDIEFVQRDDTIGTFNVSQRHNFFKIIEKNFKNNGNKRNMFLLLHEFTHLDSKFNANLPKTNADIEKYDKFESIRANNDLSSMDIFWGLVAIDEVLAQWCAEECNKAINDENENKEITEIHSILGTNVVAKTDFSDHDVYAPLEQYVKHFSKSLGYKDFKDFAKAVINGEENIYDKITNNNIETIGYIGILCEGIYQENGFQDCGLPPSDIPKAIEFLESRKNDFPSAPPGGGTDR